MDSEHSAYTTAQSRHHRYMSCFKKQRYIEVFQCSGEDMNMVLTGGQSLLKHASFVAAQQQQNNALIAAGMSANQTRPVMPSPLYNIAPAMHAAQQHNAGLIDLINRQNQQAQLQRTLFAQGLPPRFSHPGNSLLGLPPPMMPQIIMHGGQHAFHPGNSVLPHLIEDPLFAQQRAAALMLMQQQQGNSILGKRPAPSPLDALFFVPPSKRFMPGGGGFPGAQPFLGRK